MILKKIIVSGLVIGSSLCYANSSQSKVITLVDNNSSKIIKEKEKIEINCLPGMDCISIEESKK